MKKRRALLLTLLALLLVVGIPTALLLRAYRQERLNRELLAAVLGGDTNKALTALRAGANPNAHLDDEILYVSEYPASPALILTLRQGRPTPDPAQYQTSEIKNRKEPVELVKVLLDKGANPNAVGTMTKHTPLLFAAASGFDTCVRLLLQHGANVNQQDAEGESPLLAAALSNHPATLHLLLDQGANVNIKAELGTILDYMEIEPGIQPEITLILRKAGAKTGKELSSQSANPPKR